MMSTMRLSPEDDVEIRNLLALYCVLLDQDEVEQWIGLFTPDSTYHVYGRVFAGHDGLRKMMSSAPRGLHLGGPPAIEPVDHDHARAMQNALFIEASGAEMRNAFYDDELVRTPEGWRIAMRRCRFITAQGMSDRP
jgi:3-phenylpropionate/cinnamic acid dioxygenase small subunit